jgi:hypothetical protein
MALLAVIGVFALVVIGAVLISNSTSKSVVHYRNVVPHDVNSAIKQVQSIIDKYTN